MKRAEMRDGCWSENSLDSLFEGSPLADETPDNPEANSDMNSRPFNWDIGLLEDMPTPGGIFMSDDEDTPDINAGLVTNTDNNIARNDAKPWLDRDCQANMPLTKRNADAPVQPPPLRNPIPGVITRNSDGSLSRTSCIPPGLVPWGDSSLVLNGSAQPRIASLSRTNKGDGAARIEYQSNADSKPNIISGYSSEESGGSQDALTKQSTSKGGTTTSNCTISLSPSTEPSHISTRTWHPDPTSLFKKHQNRQSPSIKNTSGIQPHRPRSNHSDLASLPASEVSMLLNNSTQGKRQRAATPTQNLGQHPKRSKVRGPFVNDSDTSEDEGLRAADAIGLDLSRGAPRIANNTPVKSTSWPEASNTTNQNKTNEKSEAVVKRNATEMQRTSMLSGDITTPSQEPPRMPGKLNIARLKQVINSKSKERPSSSGALPSKLQTPATTQSLPVAPRDHKGHSQTETHTQQCPEAFKKTVDTTTDSVFERRLSTGVSKIGNGQPPGNWRTAAKDSEQNSATTQRKSTGLDGTDIAIGAAKSTRRLPTSSSVAETIQKKPLHSRGDDITITSKQAQPRTVNPSKAPKETTMFNDDLNSNPSAARTSRSKQPSGKTPCSRASNESTQNTIPSQQVKRANEERNHSEKCKGRGTPNGAGRIPSAPTTAIGKVMQLGSRATSQPTFMKPNNLKPRPSATTIPKSAKPKSRSRAAEKVSNGSGREVPSSSSAAQTGMQMKTIVGPEKAAPKSILAARLVSKIREKSIPLKEGIASHKAKVTFSSSSDQKPTSAHLLNEPSSSPSVPVLVVVSESNLESNNVSEGSRPLDRDFVVNKVSKTSFNPVTHPSTASVTPGKNFGARSERIAPEAFTPRIATPLPSPDDADELDQSGDDDDRHAQFSSTEIWRLNLNLSKHGSQHSRAALLPQKVGYPHESDGTTNPAGKVAQDQSEPSLQIATMNNASREGVWGQYQRNETISAESSLQSAPKVDVDDDTIMDETSGTNGHATTTARKESGNNPIVRMDSPISSLGSSHEPCFTSTLALSKETVSSVDSQLTQKSFTNPCSNLQLSQSTAPSQEAPPFFTYTLHQRFYPSSLTTASLQAYPSVSLSPPITSQTLAASLATTFIDNTLTNALGYGVQYRTLATHRDDHDCPSFVGTFITPNDSYAAVTTTHEIFIQRSTVSKYEPRLPDPETFFLNKTLYIIRLRKLTRLSSPSPYTTSPKERNAQEEYLYSPLPSTIPELHTTIQSANRSANRLQILLSHKENPTSLTEQKWQEGDRLRLQDKITALDPDLGGTEGKWETVFNGLRGEKWSIEVGEAGLVGARNV